MRETTSQVLVTKLLYQIQATTMRETTSQVLVTKLLYQIHATDWDVALRGGETMEERRWWIEQNTVTVTDEELTEGCII